MPMTDEPIKLPDTSKLNQNHIGLGIVISLLLLCCLCSCVCILPFVWLNDSLGGLGNPYLFWP
ncbi:MAG: hypothetical protein TR69_WS6001000485 [candidate division WS6 bacterium OLB20]|uniref:Uncharacterized protein n=1 Tax=candidate division WS6 bacterium OLB20 TaxID=1617426 RepID=A0A136LXV5_9BACT|nr:MAG: hypothetical protein TR69_WS6001000485 [candidate division WS6 bacterium OLB20]